MTKIIIAYFATMIVFFAIDFVWLGTVAKNFYQGQIGPLLLEDFRIGVAAAFYIVYLAGVTFFAARPALESGTATTALLYGAAFGFFCYATYDFTNLATLKGYTVMVALVDLAWGTFLTGISAYLGTWITLKFTA